MRKEFIKPIIIYSTLIFTCLTSCIKNDIPYPIIHGNFETFNVEGQLGTPEINTTDKTVTIQLIDTADLRKIKILDYQITDSTEILPLPGEYIDLTLPVTFTLRTWQDYIWTIKGVQTIERVFKTNVPQIGEANINDKNLTVLAYIPEEIPLTPITIEEIKLGPSNSTITPDPSTVTDFTRPQKFTVSYRDIKEEWTVIIMQSSQLAITGTAEAWGKFAYLHGTIATGTTDKPGFEYKKSSETKWKKATETVTIDGGIIDMKLTGLEDGTAYQYRAVLGSNAGETKTFTTEQIVEIPNLNFDTWSKNNKNWYANADAADSYWASGNSGVTSSLAGGKEAITSPEETDIKKGKAAKLVSIDGVTMVGAAAGNLFIGTYKTNAFEPVKSVTFGRPYAGARPTKLSGWYKYTCKPITHKGDHPVGLETDLGHIYIWLKDANDNQIAYGELVIDKTVATYTHFDIDIRYTDTSKKPSQISIVATSSKYGGDFNGLKVSGAVGAGSTLWIDEFELSYE